MPEFSACKQNTPPYKAEIRLGAPTQIDKVQPKYYQTDTDALIFVLRDTQLF
jgi:hypothetical protein